MDNPNPPRKRGWLWQGRVKEAFWSIGSLLSLLLNVILLVALIVLARELFALKAVVGDQLIGGLYENFLRMDEAVITTEVTAEDTIPVQFTLPLSQTTAIVLVQDAHIPDVTVTLNTGGLYIQNATADITLPKGTLLNVALAMEVPVDTTVPVRLKVPVNIPLRDTELHAPLTGLQQVVAPYRNLLQELPDSWDEVTGSENP